MLQLYRYLLLLSAFFLMASAAAQNSQPELNSLDQGWNSIPADAVCSSVTPYQSYAKPGGDNTELLVFFNGGGACWFGQACDTNSPPNVHSPFAEMDQSSPAFAEGIFDLDNPENPFAGYAMVFLSYCNGDIHIGAGPREYTYTTYLTGDAPGSFSLPQRLLNNYLEIENRVSDLAQYTAGGDDHIIMESPIFYQYSVHVVRFVDWVRDLISGEPVIATPIIIESMK